MRRVLVAAGSSPFWGPFSEVPVHRVNLAVESPKVKPGCALAALGLLGASASISVGALYVAYCIARAVWS